MAYTYDNFVSAANAAGLRNAFSEQDLQIAQRNPEFGLSLLSLLKDSSNASTAEQQLLATEAANQLRKSYGVYNTGTLGNGSAYAGSYGTQINDLMDQIKNYGSFDYANQEEYQKLLDSIVNQQPFNYDLQSDPSWGSYKKAYMREGDRASANALAQASAASGGRVSSYAQTAAQQVGNYYAGQLADIIPTLEQNAYSRHLSDFNSHLSSLGAMENDRAFDYENWMNEYNMLQNSLGNYQSQDATDYQRYLDAYNQQYQAQQDRLTQEQLQYENEQAAKQLAYENALALYQTLGYATPEVAKILGIGSGGVTEEASGGLGGSGGEITIDATDSTPSGDSSIDMNSVLQLGYGPIGENKLAELVAAGEVEMYEEGKQIKFKKVKSGSSVKDSLYVPALNLLPTATGKKKTTNSKSSSGSAAGGLKSQVNQAAFLR